MSSRYARPSKTSKPRRPKLTRIQVISIIFTLSVVCVLIAGVTGSIIVDAWNKDDGNANDQVQTNDDLLAQLQKAADEHPDDAKAQSQLANYLANTGQFDQALPHYEQAVKLSPDDWTLRLDFAQALMDNGKLADAEFQFDSIIQAQPQNAEAWYYEAELYLKYTPQRTDEAIFNYQQVIRYDPGSYIAQQAQLRLQSLGVVASPVASPQLSPEAGE